jgi:hypothetical protein
MTPEKNLPSIADYCTNEYFHSQQKKSENQRNLFLDGWLVIWNDDRRARARSRARARITLLERAGAL